MGEGDRPCTQRGGKTFLKGYFTPSPLTHDTKGNSMTKMAAMKLLDWAQEASAKDQALMAEKIGGIYEGLIDLDIIEILIREIESNK